MLFSPFAQFFASRRCGNNKNLMWMEKEVLPRCFWGSFEETFLSSDVRDR
jgi:hypothetical protein